VSTETTLSGSHTGVATDDAHGEGDGHDGHKSDGYYVKVAVFLAAVTGAEVALSYMGIDGWILLVPLLSLMAVKFAVVAALFMHLRFDNKILTRLFYGGLFLAVGVYIAVLSTFEVFSFAL
jgi:cytochrome c oxidase subunit 4